MPLRPLLRPVLRGPLRSPFVRGGGWGVNPATISAVKYWVDASAITGLSDGAAVSAANVLDRSASSLGALASLSGVTYRANAGNGRPAIEFNGTTSYARSPSFALTQPLRVFAVVKQITWKDGGRFWDGNTVAESQLYQFSANPVLSLYAGSNSQPTERQSLGSVFLADCTYNGTSSAIRINENVTAIEGVSPGTVGFTAGVVLGTAGNLSGAFCGNVQILDWMVVDNTATAGNIAALRAYLLTKHGLGATSEYVYLGNSLTYGTGLSGLVGGQNYPSVLHTSIGNDRIKKVNQGVLSRTTPQITAALAAEFSPVIMSGATKAIVWEGTNDIFVNGVSGATAYANLVSCVQAVKAYGVRCAVATIIARGGAGWTAGMETARTDCNALLAANHAFADGYVNLAADARLANSLDTTYYQADQTHLTAAGYAAVAEDVAPVMTAMPF